MSNRLSFMLLLAACALGAHAAEPKQDPLTGATADPGLLPMFINSAEGQVWLDVADATEPLLLVSTIVHALGSNDVGLDRAQNGEPRLVAFRTIGKRVLLVQQNTRYVAQSSDADEALAAREAFAESVLWSAEWKTSASLPKAKLIDLAALAKLDLHGVADRLKQTQQGAYSIDQDRSVVLAEQSVSHPDNVEISALLTFSGAGEGLFVQQVAADQKSLTLTQQLSFVRLPGPGFEARAYHPASGGFSIGHLDFAQAINAPLEQRIQPRFRLEKTDPNAARSPVRKPIVFYLDRGTPEPIRSALLEGANWWREAFDAAGFVDAFRAEVAPADVDMSDVRYNTITWTHRATRGWSYGGGLIDPRTGEIIKGFVNLGSQRVRQDLLIAEGLLGPYAAGADPGLKQEAINMALNRLKQLAAHEVGHALGFAHNFAASRNGDGSVLDYPHPQVRISDTGTLRLDRAYDTGVGAWDRFVVAHAYGVFQPAQEATMLASLRADIRQQGYDYVSDADARAPSDAHAEGLLWDIPGDALTGLTHLLDARRIALAGFAAGALPPDRQSGETERRLVPIYLLHRYQTDAVARLLGGVEYGYGSISDAHIGQRAVASERQHAAVSALAGLLALEILQIPDSIEPMLVPPATEYLRSPEHFDSRMAPLFDPVESARVATAVVSLHAFDTARLNRVYWQRAKDPAQPGLADVFQSLLAEPWAESHEADHDAAIARARNWTLLDAAVQAVDSGQLHADAQAQWRGLLGKFAERLTNTRDGASRQAGDWLTRYLTDPASVKLRALPRIPPGAPI